MNKTILPYIIILIITLTSCSQPDKNDSSFIVDPIENKRVDTALNLTEPNSQVTTPIVNLHLLKLKQLVSEQYEKIEGLKNKPVDSLVISNSDSISKFGYISNMFPIEEIDSIEFFGVFNKNKVSPFNLNMNTLLILYFNNKYTSEQELDSLEINYRSNFRATESMFKPGGTSFEIDDQLVVYSVNTCGPGYRNLQRIDTLINQKIFEGKDFVRLHAGCGFGPFKRIDE